ncbi:hypothetical protein B296_00038380 [Ensete ventricosum]|uniref:Uncharacterized protein n=1 Tax=Ensete ventricosum TaxID=4639 RepID=A0A426Z857_ENSVE|nr:hypothetical protein B296_00038380 [Ensete ventricosum]
MVLVLVLPKLVATFTGDCSDHLFPLPLPCKLGHGHPLFLSSRDHQDLLHIVATAPPKPSAAFKGKYYRHLTSYLIEDRINFYLFLLSNGSLSSTSKLETSGASPAGPRQLSYSSTEASFYTRPSFSCTTTVVSAPTSSDTFPTPSAADDSFYTCLPASSLLAASTALFSLPRVPVRATAHRLSVLYGEGAISSFSLSNDSKSTTAVLLSLPFRSTDCPSHSSISSAEVNRHQTFTAIDNTAVSLISGQDLHPSQELDLAGHDSPI